MTRLLLQTIVITVFTAGYSPATAQLSPPGVEGAKVVTWGAVGFSQKLSRRWTTTWYVGGSRQSDMDNYGAMKKQAIFVVNQETLYTFNPTWSLAGAVSLRYQELYEEAAPYEPEDPPMRRELRFYLRLFYRLKTGNTAWAFSFRPELREFTTPSGDAWSTPVQQRDRFKGQVNIPINASKTNTLVLANEWLFASSENSHHRWSSYRFTEDRLSTYLRHAFRKPSVYLDLGIMHQLWKDASHQAHYTAYLSVDVLFVNPFTRS